MKIVTSEQRIVSDALPQGFDGFVIAHVSDLHNRDFGDEILDVTESMHPDIIAVTGDTVHRENESAAAEKFLLGAVKLAPVYLVTGNHERVLSSYPALGDRLRDAGVNILDNEFTEIERDGAKIALLGMSDPTFFEGGKADFTAELNVMMTRIEESDLHYTVLLSHRPELFARYVSAGVNLALCGHAHGGHVRLPFIGAFYAPAQGFFPKYTEGRYSRGGKSMVVSRGLGKSSWVPRVLNPPEIVKVILNRA